jgi:hypothetical protein
MLLYLDVPQKVRYFIDFRQVHKASDQVARTFCKARKTRTIRINLRDVSSLGVWLWEGSHSKSHNIWVHCWIYSQIFARIPLVGSKPKKHEVFHIFILWKSWILSEPDRNARGHRIGMEDRLNGDRSFGIWVHNDPLLRFCVSEQRKYLGNRKKKLICAEPRQLHESRTSITRWDLPVKNFVFFFCLCTCRCAWNCDFAWNWGPLNFWHRIVMQISRSAGGQTQNVNRRSTSKTMNN